MDSAYSACLLVGLLKLERPSYRTRLAELALREAHAAFAVQLRLICAFDLTSERLSWMVGLGEKLHGEV